MSFDQRQRYGGAPAAHGSDAAGVPGKTTLVEQELSSFASHGHDHEAAAPPIAQLKISVGGAPSPTEHALEGAPAGHALPDAVRAKMEAAFGTSFEDVRVSESPQAAALGADAFAHGNQIQFAPGKYAPESEAGQRLLGHELAHVVQQRSGRVSKGQAHGASTTINRDASLEAEADAAGELAARGASVAPELTGSASGSSARGASIVQGFQITIDGLEKPLINITEVTEALAKHGFIVPSTNFGIASRIRDLLQRDEHFTSYQALWNAIQIPVPIGGTMGNTMSLPLPRFDLSGESKPPTVSGGVEDRGQVEMEESDDKHENEDERGGERGGILQQLANAIREGDRAWVLRLFVNLIHRKQIPTAQKVLTLWNTRHRDRRIVPTDLDAFEELYDDSEGSSESSDSGEDEDSPRAPRGGHQFDGDINKVWTPGKSSNARGNAVAHFEAHGRQLGCHTLQAYIDFARAKYKSARHGFIQQSKGSSEIHYEYDIARDVGWLVIREPSGHFSTCYRLTNADAIRNRYSSVLDQIAKLSNSTVKEVREELERG